METALVVALISAAVSLCGAFVTIYVARKARESTIAQLRLGAEIRDAEETIKGLRTFSRDAELLRVKCWSLLAEISRLKRPPARIDLSRLENHAYRGFIEQLEQFMNSWAGIKAEIDDTRREIIQALRHECRAHADNLHTVMLLLIKSYKRESVSNETVERFVADVGEATQRLLGALENLIRFISTVKMERLEVLIEEGGSLSVVSTPTRTMTTPTRDGEH